MAVIEIAKIRVRRGQENQTGVPQLDSGEFGWAQDTENLYIGKRIAEGAVSDENTRILTENDLDNIFALLSNATTATINTVYQYREGVGYIGTATVARLLQNKLDDTVNLSDFGVVPSFTATDITFEFKKAVNTLFYNSTWTTYSRKDARRTLIVPAGEYLISEVIDLPPFTTIEGEGSNLTTLTLTDGTGSMFRTVDGDGNRYESGLMASGIRRAREVHLRGMTLEYSTSTTSTYALLTLDNVLNAQIEDVTFRTQFSSTSTTTYGLTNWGIGIQLRGEGGGLGSGDTNLAENIQITNCKFDSLYRGIQGTGTVIRPVIENSVFSNLIQGIALYTTDTAAGPVNSHISGNRFENIVQEGVFIGENPAGIRTNHVTNDNFFIQVGNGLGLDDLTTGTQYSVMKFESQGNKSENDYFQRKSLGSTTSATNFYYNPIVTGNVYIKDSAMTTATVTTSTQAVLTRIPLTGQDQMVTMNYQLYNDTLSRKGTALINVAANGYASITDTYNYSEFLMVRAGGITADTAKSSTTVLAITTSTLTAEAYQLLSTLEPGQWYLTSDRPLYSGKSAYIEAVYGEQNGTLTFGVFSQDPVFDFSLGGTYTYTLLYQDNQSLEIEVLDANTASNYVEVVGTNQSILNSLTIEYQFDIIT